MTLICTGLVPDSSAGRFAVRIVIGRVWCPGRVVWLPEGVPLFTRIYSQAESRGKPSTRRANATHDWHAEAGQIADSPANAYAAVPVGRGVGGRK
jgi:hypothetical protein